MFKVSPASLQTFIDTPNCVLEDRVQNSTVQIPNVFCDGHLQIINCVGIVIVRCTENFLSLCIYNLDVVANFITQLIHIIWNILKLLIILDYNSDKKNFGNTSRVLTV